jgi:hypothetical protein
VTARLFRFGFVPVSTFVAIVVGCHPRRMVRPCHLSADHSSYGDDDPVEVFTGGTARFFDTAARAIRRAHCRFLPPALSRLRPCSTCLSRMERPCKNQRQDGEKQEFMANRRVS